MKFQKDLHSTNRLLLISEVYAVYAIRKRLSNFNQHSTFHVMTLQFALVHNLKDFHSTFYPD